MRAGAERARRGWPSRRWPALIAACLPAFGATSLTSPTGAPSPYGKITRRRTAHRPRPAGPSPTPSARRRDAPRHHRPTGDPAADTSPQIARDPSTGFIVASGAGSTACRRRSPTPVRRDRLHGRPLPDLRSGGRDVAARRDRPFRIVSILGRERPALPLRPGRFCRGHLFAPEASAARAAQEGADRSRPGDAPSSSFAGAARANPGGRATGSTGRLVTSPDATLQAGQDVPVVTGNSDGGSKNPPKASVWGAGATRTARTWC